MRRGRGLGRRWGALLIGLPAGIALIGATEPDPSLFDATKCAALSRSAEGGAPVSGLKITATNWRAEGTQIDVRGGKSAPFPAHCEVTGRYGEHAGRVGGPYRTAFRMRLPQAWNGRYFFQGGGGSNGVVGDATGFNGPGNKTGLERGYAVIAQDSGHDNALNVDASRGAELVFGHDPVARANYGHASLKPTYDLGLHIIRTAYGREPITKVFWGCSKGGQEGMAFAQRYPEAFDGIVAMAPGFALPRAALAQTWDVQQFSAILRAKGITPTVDTLKTAIPADRLRIVADTVLKVCDADDGLADGIVAAVGMCTSRRVVPALRQRQCTPRSQNACLDKAQIDGLQRVIDGVRDSRGRALYAPFAWDTGVAEPGWRMWKLGMENGRPAANVALGGGSLAAVFMNPPVELPADPAKLLAWQLAFDFDKQGQRIYTVAPPYRTSAWADIAMRSTDLSAFRAHGGKMIVPHGMSDPVFSALDTIDWWTAVNRINRGRASDFVRVFPVPGMNHCGGGAATDRFDSLTALETWVVRHEAPASITATAGPGTPWPGRNRPLCPYPKTATAAADGRFSCQNRP